MDRQATCEQIPETMTLRLVEIQVHEPGFRVESLTVVTTLLDPEQYPREDIADLYRQRWLAELDIRAIKKNLGMDILRCKTPAMVRRRYGRACRRTTSSGRRCSKPPARPADRRGN